MMKTEQNKKIVNIIFLIIIIAIFVSFASFSLNKPFTLDELMNINVIKGISNEGVPIGYLSEDLTFIYPVLNPPLTHYFLSIGYSIFNNKEVGTRIIPMIFCIGTIILVYLISKQIFRRKNNMEKIALTSSLLFALSPLVVQNSTLVSVDMILLFFTILFIYIFIKSYKGKLFSISTLVLILLVAVMIWCKFANIPIVFISLFLYSIIDRNLKVFLKIIMIGLFGSALFAGSWYIYIKDLGLPFLNFLISNASYGSSDKLIALFSLEGILLRLWTIKSIMFWTTPFFLILVVFALVKRIKKYIAERKTTFIDFFIIFSFLVILQYLTLYPSSYGFPKHFVAMVPGFSMLIAYYISKFKLKDCFKKKKVLYALLIAITLVTIFNFVFLKDPFIEHNIFYSKSITIQNNFDEYLISNIKGIIFFVPFAIIFVVFYPTMKNFVFQASNQRLKLLKKEKYSFYYTIVFSMFITIIVSSIYIDYVQAKADYSTKWGYGESGFLETSKYIREHTSEDDLIISRSSIAYYAQRRYYMSYPNPDSAIMRQLNFRDVKLVDYPNNINKLIKSKGVPYVVLSYLEKDIYPEPEYYKVTKYGSFTIYKLNQSSSKNK